MHDSIGVLRAEDPMRRDLPAVELRCADRQPLARARSSARSPAERACASEGHEVGPPTAGRTGPPLGRSRSG
jgi:hypothetical protein